MILHSLWIYTFLSVHLFPPLTFVFCMCLQLVPDLLLLVLHQFTQCFIVCCVSVLFFALFALPSPPPTSGGRWPTSLSLDLMEVPSF